MMSEMDRKVRKAVLTVKRRRVLERIHDLLRHYEAVTFTKHVTHSEIRGLLTLNIGGAPTLFYEETFGTWHANTLYQVRYGGSLMLEVQRGLPELADGEDPRLVYRGKIGDVVVVRTFRPGLWMRLLDLKRLIRQAERSKLAAEKASARAAALRNKPEPVRLSEFSLRQRFAL